MAGNLTALAVILLGAGCATTGLLLYLSNRGLGRLHRSSHRLETRLLPTAMLLLGTGLAMMGWLIIPPSADLPPDINVLLSQTPTASGSLPASAAKLQAGSVLLLVWGTPSDMDKADEQAEQAYSYAIGKALSTRLRAANPGLRVENLLMTQQEQEKVLLSPQSTDVWCAQQQWEILALVDMSATHSSERGYAPWREPNYIFRDCSAERYRHIQGRVTERPGDNFPYEQSLEREFIQALARFSKRKG